MDSELSSDGKVKFLSAEPGRIIDIKTEVSKHIATVVSEFDEELEVFKRLRRTLKMEVTDGFLEEENTVTWILSSKYDRVSFMIKVPIERPIKGLAEVWTLFMGERKTLKLVAPVDNSLEIHFDHTVLGFRYNVTWKW